MALLISISLPNLSDTSYSYIALSAKPLNSKLADAIPPGFLHYSKFTNISIINTIWWTVHLSINGLSKINPWWDWTEPCKTTEAILPNGARRTFFAWRTLWGTLRCLVHEYVAFTRFIHISTSYLPSFASLLKTPTYKIYYHNFYREKCHEIKIWTQIAVKPPRNNFP